jgi:hypothetical protein
MCEDFESSGHIRTNRHDRVRYRFGHNSGDVFREDDDFEGTTLTIECADWNEAKDMLAAIRRMGPHPQLLASDGGT